DNLDPQQLVTKLKEQFIRETEDGKEKGYISKINYHNVEALSKSLLGKIVRGTVDFEKDMDKSLMKMYVISFFIPCLSSILEISDGDAVWNLVEILFKIMAHKVDVLTEVQRRDATFRLCHGRAVLKPNVKFPFKEEVKEQIRDATIKMTEEFEASDAAVFLKKLSCLARDNLESRINTFNFLVSLS
uniref:Uncharacterized protein n=1 Tax=Clytia hemisphaerica TaxID=252671 RepID=A0A7M5WKM8_9CNID